MASWKGGPLTKSQVNRAGRILRRHLRGEEVDGPVLTAAIEIVLNYRAAHGNPLAKANMGLRSIVRTVGCQAEVSQRLKRIPTILDKLRREPTMALGNMQDIGGCRAVLNSIEEIRRVEQRLRKNRHPISYADYMTQPRPTGYRAVHVVVCYEDQAGEDRAIEVQLRTHTMHEWAIAVERLGGRLHADLKGGEGPHELLELLSVVSKAMELEELGQIVSNELLVRMRQLRRSALPYLRAGK